MHNEKTWKLLKTELSVFANELFIYRLLMRDSFSAENYMIVIKNIMNLYIYKAGKKDHGCHTNWRMLDYILSDYINAGEWTEFIHLIISIGSQEA